MRRRLAVVAAAAAVMLVSVSRVLPAQGATAILDRIRVNTSRPIDFHAIALPESVYVGQQATYQVAVLLSADARARLRRNPEFLPPELRGLLAYELGTPIRVPPRSFDGATYEAHVFQRALFPVAAGRQVVPAPQLTYALPQSSSYFSREERFVVRAESASFVARPLPLDGRPADFNGAVGVFKATARLDTTTARVGDPLVLTLRVQGTGNVKLLPRPGLELDWASAVPGTERVQVDSSGLQVRGTKEFDWILTPARSGRVALPALRYSYFDPYARKYAVAETAPMEFGVRSGALAVADEGEGSVLLPLRAVTREPRAVVQWSGRGQPPTAWWPWLLLVALVPVPALWSARRRARGRAAASVPSETSAPGRVSAAAASAAATVDDGARGVARRARRTMLDRLAERFGEAPQAMASRRQVARTLRRAGVTRETTRDVLAWLDQLDEAGFAAHTPTEHAATTTADATRRVTELMRRVDAEAMPRGKRIGAGHGLLLVVLTTSALVTNLHVRTLRAQSAPAASVNDAQGGAASDDRRAAATAYERRAFGEAVRRFGALAAQHPRDPDVLANWGTAAWAAGDTVHAVIAWQRAARLEPLAPDLQERLALLPAGARGGIADIPMVPVPLLLRATVALWVIGWLLLAWRGRRPESARAASWMRGTAGVAIVLAVAAAGSAWWGMRVLDAEALSVVARPETMRVAPGTDADAMGGVTTGDVVRIEESRAGWQRVLHADGRRGWLPAARLVALDDATGALSDPLPAAPSAR